MPVSRDIPLRFTSFRLEPLPLKHRAAERWVQRRLGSIDHERRVCDVAGHLFDLTSPLHDLGDADRRLLRLAAVVHDVGRCDGDDGHHRRGAEMLLADASLPLSAAERRALAFLTRYHKGRLPEPGDETILTAPDRRPALWLALGLLRAADALDGRALRRSPPRLVFGLTGRRLSVHVYLDAATDARKARKVYSKPKKFRLLEELLGVTVATDLHEADALRMVA